MTLSTRFSSSSSSVASSSSSSSSWWNQQNCEGEEKKKRKKKREKEKEFPWGFAGAGRFSFISTFLKYRFGPRLLVLTRRWSPIPPLSLEGVMFVILKVQKKKGPIGKRSMSWQYFTVYFNHFSAASNAIICIYVSVRAKKEKKRGVGLEKDEMAKKVAARMELALL